MSFYAIIPAGGIGSRLWPLSRAGRPKFLTDLTGCGRTMIQETLMRIAPLSEAAYVVTGKTHVDEVARQLELMNPESRVRGDSDALRERAGGEFSASGDAQRERAGGEFSASGDKGTIPLRYVVEPSARGTMAAIGLAAHLAMRENPNAIIGSFAADHAIADVPAFQASLREAIEQAEAGFVVTIGISPTYPATGFGYIHQGDKLPHVAGGNAVGGDKFGVAPLSSVTFGCDKVGDDKVAVAPLGVEKALADPVHADNFATDPQNVSNEGAETVSAYIVEKFVEKPDEQRARRYVESGTYLWNAGMFIARASVLVEALERFRPDIALPLARVAQAWDVEVREQNEQVRALWEAIPKAVIDRAIAEPLAACGGVAVVPADIGWSDVGDYKSLAENRGVYDALGRSAHGEVADSVSCTTDAGAQEPGAQGLGTQEPGAEKSNTHESSESFIKFSAQGLGVHKAGAQGLSVSKVGAEEPGAQKRGVQGVSAQEPGRTIPVTPDTTVVAIDSPGTLAVAGSKPVVVLGIPGAVVVDMDDVIFVTRQESAQGVKDIVENLDAYGLGHLR
ncbi:mannose-1-phosphate guanylyltransferase [Actinotignum urinale]|uniref:mannose-1-phosphate guanylyltransferase n=1 Tax=Actinotignum urinale TaxID=190146 RepID=UPI002A7FCBC0|nr:mannose-1-phosphate guanylyltransferase [Actinotignum urinale]MDY5128946.1 mannose-1-phosphate guanylyltransferase [Actinotignum urinale]